MNQDIKGTARAQFHNKVRMTAVLCESTKVDDVVVPASLEVQVYFILGRSAFDCDWCFLEPSSIHRTLCREIENNE
jgi:coenzyme F420-reducing hydrogenase delta subunit